MSSPIEMKKTRKPRTTMKSVVTEVVRQKSLNLLTVVEPNSIQPDVVIMELSGGGIVPVETRTVLDNDKQEAKRIQAEVDAVQDILERTRVMSTLSIDEIYKMIAEEGFKCDTCNKMLRRNTPMVIARHNASFYHQQSALRLLHKLGNVPV